MDFLKNKLNDLKDKGLLRTLRDTSSPQGREIVLDGQRVLNFCSNDYLNLAADLRLMEAASHAMDQSGFGSGASRLVSGNMSYHSALEAQVAKLKKTEASLMFSSGYMANVGIISSLCSSGDIVFSDRLNHASIIDGIVLSRADLVRYAHCDMQDLRRLLEKAPGDKKKMIVTDSVFSMDGDRAPLKEIVELAQEFEALLMVDEAHAFGVLGSNGMGLVEELGLTDRVPVQMGTFSKATGSFGAYVTGSQTLIDFLINYARSFIFTTSLPALVSAASFVALRIIEDEPVRRVQVLEKSERLRMSLQEMGYDTLQSSTPIIPIMVGNAAEAVRMSHALLKEGIFVQAIRPPTVPQGTARLRLTVTSGHTDEDIKKCLKAFVGVRGAVSARGGE